MIDRAASAGAGADDLQEAEAVDRGALERRHQRGVERFGDRLSRGLALQRREVDADRAADAVTADRCGDCLRRGDGGFTHSRAQGGIDGG